MWPYFYPKVAQPVSFSCNGIVGRYKLAKPNFYDTILCLLFLVKHTSESIRTLVETTNVKGVYYRENIVPLSHFAGKQINKIQLLSA